MVPAGMCHETVPQTLIWSLIAGRSNALYIAERLGLEPAIIEAARANLGAYASAANAAIADLEVSRCAAPSYGVLRAGAC